MDVNVPRYPWLLFDLDGTLLDYHAAEHAALFATLEDAGLSATDEVAAVYRRINAGHWAALERRETTPERLRVERWRDLLIDQGHAATDATAIADAYIQHLSEGAHLIEGAVALLDHLADQHRIAFITNGLADVQRPRLAAAGLADRAEVTVISDEVGVAKPHAAIFDVVFEGMGGPAREDVVIVGDSLTSDIAGGHGYGIDTVWFAPHDQPVTGEVVPTHRIAVLGELPDLVG